MYRLVPLTTSEVCLFNVLLLLAHSGAYAGGDPVEGAQTVHMAPTYGVTAGGDPLLWRQEPAVLHGREPGRVDLVLGVQPGFTVYRDFLEVEVLGATPGLKVGMPDLPPGVVRLVPGRDEVAREQYDADVIVHLPVQSTTGQPGLETMHVRVQHQACVAGHCFRPKEHILAVHVPVREPPPPVEPPPVDREGLPVPAP